MVAKIILATLAFWGFVGLALFALAKYAVPAYYDWKKDATEYDYERDVKKMERDEALVEEAERDSNERR